MTISPETKKALIALPAVLIVGYFVYSTFFASSEIVTPVVVAEGENAEILGQDILVMVEKLKAISIDSSIFSGVAMTHLQDFSSFISPEMQGRPNPFVLLGTEKK